MYTPEQTAALLGQTPVAVTSRELDTVLYIHQLTPRDIIGKKILDLGCGRSSLQAELDAKNIGATVIGIDRTDVALRGFRPDRDAGKRYAQADLTALPIQDSSVDIALATYSLPYWAKDRDAIDAFFTECARVVRTGGFISIAPMVGAAHLEERSDCAGRDYSPYMSARKAFPADVWKEIPRKKATYTVTKR